MEPIFSDEYLHKMREAYALANVSAKQLFSDEHIQHLHEVLEEIARQWNRSIEQFTQAGGNWDKMQELAIYSSHSNPPNLYARETAKRRKCDPQKLRKTDLYFRSKPPIMRRS